MPPWLLNEGQARDSATAFLSDRMSANPRWPEFTHRVLSGLLLNRRGSPDVEELERRLKAEFPTFMEQPFILLLFKTTTFAMKIMNNNRNYPNTLAFPPDDVEMMVNNVTLLTVTAALKGNSNDDKRRLREMLAQPQYGNCLRSWLAQPEHRAQIDEEVRQCKPQISRLIMTIGIPLSSDVVGALVDDLINALMCDPVPSLTGHVDALITVVMSRLAPLLVFVMMMNPALAQGIPGAVEQMLNGAVQDLLLPQIIERLSAEVKTQLPALAEQASRCAAGIMKAALQLAHFREVPRRASQSIGKEKSDAVPVDVLTGVIRLLREGDEESKTTDHSEEKRSQQGADGASASSTVDACPIISDRGVQLNRRPSPLNDLQHTLDGINLDDDIVSLHVLQSSTTAAVEVMRTVEAAIKPLEQYSKGFFLNNLDLLPFVHVSLLATSASGNRSTSHTHSHERRGVIDLVHWL